MGTPPRRVRVRTAPGDVVEITQGSDGSLHVVVRPSTNNGKPPSPLKWTDKLRTIYEASSAVPCSRDELMTRAGYPFDTHAHAAVRKLLAAGWLLEDSGLVRRNPSPPGEPPS